MKIISSASSIVLLSCILLTGCGVWGLPDLSRTDEVPADVKAAPRVVEKAPPLTGNEPWPRLGDVPFKPENFTPKPVYNHYMNELEYDRAVGFDAKDKVEEQTPEPDASFSPRPKASSITPVEPAPLSAPELPQLPKE